jgi:hypothetical protein
MIVTNYGTAGNLTGAWNFCSYMEEMRQPPDSDVEMSCPPNKGPVMVDYIMWFANFIVPAVRSRLAWPSLERC